jgi:putative transposase
VKYNPAIHHRRSIRLKGYDYSQAGLYFITICCQDRAQLFGGIINGVMKLNDAGDVARRCWTDIPDHFPNAVLHQYVIMPNHIHGIVELVGANNHSPENQTIPDQSPVMKMGKNHSSKNQTNENHPPEINNGTDVNDRVMGDNGAVGAKNLSPLMPLPRSPSKTIGSIVRSFKIGVTKWMRQNTGVYHVW